MTKGTPRIRKMLYVIGLLILAGLTAFALGPRPSSDTTVEFDEATLPDDLDAYLAASEGQFEDLRPGNERQIVWAYPASRARTPLASPPVPVNCARCPIWWQKTSVQISIMPV